MITFPVTAEYFRTLTGHDPVDDDLERCNCRKAGEFMHRGCGMCKHDQPVFMCHICFKDSHKLKGRQVNEQASKDCIG